jgi:pimeloyl-ACP methyl ester carboxylesterase
MTRRGLLGAGVSAGVAFVAAADAAEPNLRATPFYAAPQMTLPYRPLRAKSTDGTELAVQDWGHAEGPEILFIHGVLQSHLSFERQVRSDLAERFRMVTYDLRGHGDSDKPIGRDRYLNGELWADDLAAVIAQAGLRRPVVVGWSLGGLPIGNYLMKYGDARLAGLHFVDALTKRSRDYAGRPEYRGLLPATASPDLGTRIDALRGFLRACFKTQPSEADFERMLAFNAQVPQHVLSHIMAGVPLEADDAYRAVRVPVLVAHGAEDALLNVSITAFDRAVMPHARLSIYQDCGHAPFHEMTERFNSELAAFVLQCQ